MISSDKSTNLPEDALFLREAVKEQRIQIFNRHLLDCGPVKAAEVLQLLIITASVKEREPALYDLTW